MQSTAAVEWLPYDRIHQYLWWRRLLSEEPHWNCKKKSKHFAGEVNMDDDTVTEDGQVKANPVVVTWSFDSTAHCRSLLYRWSWLMFYHRFLCRTRMYALRIIGLECLQTRLQSCYQKQFSRNAHTIYNTVVDSFFLKSDGHGVFVSLYELVSFWREMFKPICY